MGKTQKRTRFCRDSCGVGRDYRQLRADRALGGARAGQTLLLLRGHSLMVRVRNPVGCQDRLGTHGRSARKTSGVSSRFVSHRRLSSVGLLVRKTRLLRHCYLKMTSFNQDRLGTNVGKAGFIKTKSPRFLSLLGVIFWASTMLVEHHELDDVVLAIPVRTNRYTIDAKENGLFFECFPYVCPEPVLVK
jgi:hypothetical protein